MRKFLGTYALIGLLTSLVFVGCTGSTAKILPNNESAKESLVAGSGSNLAITGELIKEFNKKYSQSIKLPNSIGSSGGIQAVCEGAVHLGLTSRPLKDSEKKLGLKEIPYARIGIVLGVNMDVPDTGITSQDLADIYSGKKNKWKNGKTIVVLAREEGDSTNSALKKLVPGYQQALEDSYRKKRWQIMFSDGEEADAIINTLSSFGFTDTAAIQVKKLPIKALKVDGVEPNINNLAQGKYKLYKDLYFVYKDNLAKEPQEFLNFVYSDQGRKIISGNGGIPLQQK